MAGNAKNTSQWEGADVFIAPVDSEGPDDLVTAWSGVWQGAGLLDGEEGFTEGRDEDTSESYAWGGILYRRTKSKHKRTIKFVALEDNAVTFRLRNPGSKRTASGGVRTSKVVIPKSDAFAIGFELRDGDKVKRRTIRHAEVSEVGEIKESETDPTVYEFTVLIFPEADGTLYTDVETDTESASAPAGS
jgi:hypothetical protein